MITLGMMQNKERVAIGQRYLDTFSGYTYRILNILTTSDGTRKYVVKSNATEGAFEVTPRNGETNFVLLNS